MMIETYRGESFNINNRVRVSLGEGTMWYVCSDEGDNSQIIIGTSNPVRARYIAKDINFHLNRGAKKLTLESLTCMSVE